MSPTDDTQPNRGRPVLKRIDAEHPNLHAHAEAGDLWVFCGEFDGREPDAIEAAYMRTGGGIFQAFAAGSWGRGYWRD